MRDSAGSIPAGDAEQPRARRIVVIMHDFPNGGTERIIITLANLWAARGREVTIVCGSEAGPTRDRVAKTVSVRRTPVEIRRGVRSRSRLGHAVAAMLRDDPPDVIVAPGNFHLPVLHAMRGLAVPRVCKLSNPLTIRPRRALAGWLFRRSLRQRTRGLALLVAMTPSLADEARGATKDVAIATIFQPNIADDRPLPDIRAPRWPPRLLCASRLVPQKHVALALRGFAALDCPGARLTIAGDGPERAELERLATSLGIAADVRFAGDRADIAPLLAEADLLLSTSRYEGYPAVLVEALAAGIPVVTTPSSPSIAEILIDPSFGRVVAADPAALAGAIAEVAHGPGPDRAALGVLLDRHRAGRSAEAWLAALDGVVAARR